MKQQNSIEQMMMGAGFYSWCVPENTLTADRAFADIYEIDERSLAHGVPVELILSRIVEEDRPRLAERVHDVILGGQSRVSAYRILCPSGRVKTLRSMGSCAKDTEGVPSVYSGIVLLSDAPMTEPRSQTLEQKIADAIALSRNSGQKLAERYLISALHSIS
ncbi:PAS domain-containing protein [Agrobacterium larrymoorei]|uniref:PAS domain-containing protein n=1 Tax=Agrobacterium larrymoorei TaxID=160699 RepID=A0A4D7DYK9_9HYPH|nr:PAS domain-containing protein [Agrobacterium larrymoorei]QCI99282.1 hypothetical protein CFBP5473_14740 [Agrobacterium larrymoorei]QYA08818.1 PAS domain-containing protein [Agrobacterium larrymoorei]